MESLQGQLLISGGGLLDPNFRHTVVLVGEHDREGALGLVLNRPTRYRVEEAVPPLAPLVSPGELLYSGGPVRPEQPVLLAEFTDVGLADVLVFGSVGFLTGDVPAQARTDIRRVRVFAGYSGWGPGQLDVEMESGSWIVELPLEEDVFTTAPESLWARILQRKGGQYTRLASMPYDPSMN